MIIWVNTTATSCSTVLLLCHVQRCILRMQLILSIVTHSSLVVKHLVVLLNCVHRSIYQTPRRPEASRVTCWEAPYIFFLIFHTVEYSNGSRFDIIPQFRSILFVQGTALRTIQVPEHPPRMYWYSPSSVNNTEYSSNVLGNKPCHTKSSTKRS